MTDERFVLPIPQALLDALAERVAEMVADRLADTTTSSRYLDVDGAAAYLVCKRQRIYDLVNAETLAASRDGRRLLFTRDALDAALTHDERCHPVATDAAGADEHRVSDVTLGQRNRASEAA